MENKYFAHMHRIASQLYDDDDEPTPRLNSNTSRVFSLQALFNFNDKQYVFKHSILYFVPHPNALYYTFNTKLFSNYIY